MLERHITHLKKILSQDLRRKWTVEDMAAAVRVSVPHLHRLFREANEGVTPMSFLHDLRLETAREMLADPTCFLLIKEIGLKVGLKNESHFTQDFKKKYGLTPTQYRKQQDELHQSEPPDGQE